MSVPPLSSSPRGDSGLAKMALVLGLTGVIVAGTTGAVLLGGEGDPLASVPTPQVTPPAPPVSLALAGERGTTVPWERPLTFAVTAGTIRNVIAVGPAGTVPGTLAPTRWTGSRTLIPGESYSLSVQVVNGDGKVSTIDRHVTAAAADKVLVPEVSPSDGSTVGIGQPVVVRFNEPVEGEAARKAVLARLQVTSVPAVAGAWRWYNGTEVHYRGPSYWQPGTTVKIEVDLNRFRVPGSQVWGAAEAVTKSFTVGDAMVSIADINAHTLTVRRNGTVLRVLKMSAGNEKYPTKGGVHIVLNKEKVHLFNSATVGIPTADPDGYYKELPWSVRISNGGAFVHSQPGSVRSQGIRNVSHGCINLSPADAEWYFGVTKRGDLVDVVHAVVPANSSDAGMFDWNYSWSTWKTGNLTG